MMWRKFNRLVVVFVGGYLLTGCATYSGSGAKECDLPGYPACIDVQSAYKASMRRDLGDNTAGGANQVVLPVGGYQPRGNPTVFGTLSEPALSFDEFVKKEKLRFNKKVAAKRYKEYLEQRKELAKKAAYKPESAPAPDASGFFDNGVPRLPAPRTDSDLFYYEKTAGGRPTGWVPARLVRVWIPDWISRTGDHHHATYFDLVVRQGHFAHDLQEKKLLPKSVLKQPEQKETADGYVKYVLKTNWGHVIWEKDAYGNVTVTRKPTKGEAEVRYFPAGSPGVPLPVGKQVYPKLVAGTVDGSHRGSGQSPAPIFPTKAKQPSVRAAQGNPPVSPMR